jgi:23S rRNA pseudouridine1911/1915/1917 synthase
MSLFKRARDYSPPHVAVPSAVDGAALSAEVPAELAGRRLDQALARLFPQFSRTRLAAWVKSERVCVDGAPASPRDKVWGGERVELQADPAPAQAWDLAQDIELKVLHEDPALLVIDKPAGMVVHPGSGNRDGTLLNALLHHARALSAMPRAGIVHRLDKDTSGLLVVAKTLTAHASLVRQLQAHSVKRDYLALVAGVPPRQGRVTAPIGRHPVQRTRMAVMQSGKPAVTHYRTLRSGAGWSLLECMLETGRTHQIRVHLSGIGYPLLGDPVYLGAARGRVPAVARSFPRQALHATRLALEHPVTLMPMSWHSPLPADLAALLQALEQHAPAR